MEVGVWMDRMRKGLLENPILREEGRRHKSSKNT